MDSLLLEKTDGLVSWTMRTFGFKFVPMVRLFALLASVVPIYMTMTGNTFITVCGVMYVLGTFLNVYTLEHQEKKGRDVANAHRAMWRSNLIAIACRLLFVVFLFVDVPMAVFAGENIQSPFLDVGFICFLYVSVAIVPSDGERKKRESDEGEMTLQRLLVRVNENG